MRLQSGAASNTNNTRNVTGVVTHQAIVVATVESPRSDSVGSFMRAMSHCSGSPENRSRVAQNGHAGHFSPSG